MWICHRADHEESGTHGGKQLDERLEQSREKVTDELSRHLGAHTTEYKQNVQHMNDRLNSLGAEMQGQVQCLENEIKGLDLKLQQVLDAVGANPTGKTVAVPVALAAVPIPPVAPTTAVTLVSSGCASEVLARSSSPLARPRLRVGNTSPPFVSLTSVSHGAGVAASYGVTPRDEARNSSTLRPPWAAPSQDGTASQLTTDQLLGIRPHTVKFHTHR